MTRKEMYRKRKEFLRRKTTYDVTAVRYWPDGSASTQMYDFTFWNLKKALDFIQNCIERGTDITLFLVDKYVEQKGYVDQTRVLSLDCVNNMGYLHHSRGE